MPNLTIAVTAGESTRIVAAFTAAETAKGNAAPTVDTAYIQSWMKDQIRQFVRNQEIRAAQLAVTTPPDIA